VQLPHAPQLQLELQVRVRCPQLPHPCVSWLPGEHDPSSVQELQLPQLQFWLHVRVRVPQSPHESVSTSPGVHTPSPQVPHAPQVQSLWQVRS
jgi:hypothetical protein